MRPMVTAVAVDEPETAAKMPEPITFTCSRRPGSRRTQGARPVNMSSDRRVRNRISPIQMNSGKAVMAHSELCPHTVVASNLPTGALEKKAMPITPTVISDRAIHRPPPSKMKMAASKTPTAAVCSMVFTRAPRGGLRGCQTCFADTTGLCR